jgi:hypothetical protein
MVSPSVSYFVRLGRLENGLFHRAYIQYGYSHSPLESIWPGESVARGLCRGIRTAWSSLFQLFASICPRKPVQKRFWQGPLWIRFFGKGLQQTLIFSQSCIMIWMDLNFAKIRKQLKNRLTFFDTELFDLLTTWLLLPGWNLVPWPIVSKSVCIISLAYCRSKQVGSL